MIQACLNLLACFCLDQRYLVLCFLIHALGYLFCLPLHPNNTYALFFIIKFCCFKIFFPVSRKVKHCWLFVLKRYIIWLTGFNSRYWGWGTQKIILYPVDCIRRYKRFREDCQNWRWMFSKTIYIHFYCTTGKSYYNKWEWTLVIEALK